MRRREVVAGLLGAAAASTESARAQQGGQPRRLGVLFVVGEDNPEGAARIAALRQGLESFGWIEGKTIQIDYRFGASDAERIRRSTAELLDLRPNVILAQGVVGTAALQRATTEIPVVFVQVVDPVGGGFVDNLARPSGNITGFTDFEYAISGKWLELLKEIAPSVTRALALINPDNRRRWEGYFRTMESAASALSIAVSGGGVRDAADIDRSVEAFAREPNGGLLVLPDATTAVHLKRIIALAAQHRLPAVFPYAYFARSGGLLAYSSGAVEQYRRAAAYIDRLLRGAEVAELPVQASDKFELVINLKTAKALDLTVPPTLLARADEVIE